LLKVKTHLFTLHMSYSLSCQDCPLAQNNL
jgi:hypothetical protein